MPHSRHALFTPRSLSASVRLVIALECAVLVTAATSGRAKPDDDATAIEWPAEREIQ